jgi:hypothetical protein
VAAAACSGCRRSRKAKTIRELTCGWTQLVRVAQPLQTPAHNKETPMRKKNSEVGREPCADLASRYVKIVRCLPDSAVSLAFVFS